MSSVEFSLTVFPKPAAFVKPVKRTLHNPAFGKDHKLMELVAFDNLHTGTDGFPDCLRKRFTGLSAIAKNIYDTGQGSPVVFQHPESARLV